MEELTDRNSYVKATNADGVCILEATVKQLKDELRSKLRRSTGDMV